MMNYYIFVLIFLIPAAIVDDVISAIEATGWRYLLRIIWLFLVFFVIKLIPKPAAH